MLSEVSENFANIVQVSKNFINFSEILQSRSLYKSQENFKTSASFHKKFKGFLIFFKLHQYLKISIN